MNLVSLLHPDSATTGALCRTLLEMAAPSAFYTHKCIVKHIKMGLAVQDRSRDLFAGEILVENQAVPRPSHAPTLHSYGRGNAASSRSITTGAFHSLKFGSSTSKLTIQHALSLKTFCTPIFKFPKFSKFLKILIFRMFPARGEVSSSEAPLLDAIFDHPAQKKYENVFLFSARPRDSRRSRRVRSKNAVRLQI